MTRARFFALFTFFLALPALPQCNFSVVLSDQFRSSILDLAIDGNDLWAATSYGVSLFDRGVDPPRLVTSIPIAGTTRLIRLGNGLAYAGSGNSIAIIRKSGRSLQFVRMVDAGAPVNDLVVTALLLFVATQNGIAQYGLTDPANPNSPLQLTRTAATSLALAGTTLYAARGDSTVDIFTISPIVQNGGSIGAPASVTAVHANNGKLFVSTAVQTYVFVGSTNVGSVPFSLTSLTALSGDAVFAAGTDRTLRGIDFSLPGTPIDIFRGEVPVSSGTINRVTALAAAGGRLYAAAGDAGIAEYDVSNFTSPFPMRGYPFADASSVVSTGANFYAGRTAGITEFSQTPNPKRSWDGSRSDTVQDGDGTANFLLSSSGATLTLWTLASTIPQSVTTVTFRVPVTKAVLSGTTAYAVLSDRTLWSADLTQAQPVPQQISTPNLAPVSIASWGNSIVLADTRSDGTTAIAYYPDIQSAPSIVTVAGLATTPVTLSGSVAAVQTFRGISLIDFKTSIAGVLPQSNADVARQLILSGATLLELTDTSVRVWNVQSQTVAAELRLPGQPLAMHVAPQSNVLDVISTTDVVTVALDGVLRMPSPINAPNGNAFYRKVIASAGHVDLIDARGVDIYSDAMHFIGSIRDAGIVDAAATDTGLFTISSNLTVRAFAPDGFIRSTATIAEGADAQALAVNAVGGAIWVSIIRGCTSGACEKKTLVFDSSLNQTMSMSGGIIDVVTSGNRAYAITDLPAEIRVISIADPLHPSIVNSRAADGTPQSIAFANGTIYVFGSGLASYSEASLTKTADLFSGTSNPDEHIRIDGSCAILTGRDSSPQLFTLPQFTAAAAFATPSTARMVAARPGTFYVLTDHSLEIWSTSLLPKPARREPAAR